MLTQRTKRKIIFSVGTLGFILAVVGATTDYIDVGSVALQSFGIIGSGIGLMMTATVIVKESTTWLDCITCLDSRDMSTRCVPTSLGGLAILMGCSPGLNILMDTLIRIILKKDNSTENLHKVSWSFGLIFIGGIILLFTGCIDLCNNYSRDDDAEAVANDSEAEENDIVEVIFNTRAERNVNAEEARDMIEMRPRPRIIISPPED